MVVHLKKKSISGLFKTIKETIIIYFVSGSDFKVILIQKNGKSYLFW